MVCDFIKLNKKVWCDYDYFVLRFSNHNYDSTLSTSNFIKASKELLKQLGIDE